MKTLWNSIWIAPDGHRVVCGHFETEADALASGAETRSDLVIWGCKFVGVESVQVEEE